LYLRITQFLCAAGMTVGLLLGMQAPGAHAAPIGPGGDTHQRGCALLQDEVFVLLREYKLTSTTTERRTQNIARLRDLGQTWDDAGCRDRFGDITGRLRPGHLGPLPAAPPQGALAPPANPPSRLGPLPAAPRQADLSPPATR
jgi:hypothetical protein